MNDSDDFITDPAIRQILEEPETCLKDDGFVQAVMERVPPPAPALPVTRRRTVVFGLAALAACAMTWLSMGELLPALIPASSRNLADFAPMTIILLIGSGVLLVCLYPVAEIIGRALALRRER
jgi:hypothetical protein